MSDPVFSVYMLRCADGTLYTGIATDVARRLAEHGDGRRGAKCLRGKGPLELVFSVAVGSRAEASKLEHRIKQLDRGAKELVVRGRFDVESLLGHPSPAQASGMSSG